MKVTGIQTALQIYFEKIFIDHLNLLKADGRGWPSPGLIIMPTPCSDGDAPAGCDLKGGR